MHTDIPLPTATQFVIDDVLLNMYLRLLNRRMGYGNVVKHILSLLRIAMILCSVFMSIKV